MDKCKDCGGIQFVETREADLTCIRCGLVAQSHLFEDTINSRTLNSYALEYDTVDPFSDNHTINLPNPKYTKTKEDGIHLQVLRRTIEDKFNISHTSPCGQLIQALYVSKEQKHNKVWSAVCIFYGTKVHKQGFPVHGICNILEVDVKHFWHESKEAMNSWKHLNVYAELQVANQTFDCITRMIHSLIDIHEEDRWRIVKVATSMANDEYLMETLHSVKPSCLSVTFIYIACKIEGIPISIQRLSKSFCVSQATINKQETRIQAILSGRM